MMMNVIINMVKGCARLLPLCLLTLLPLCTSCSEKDDTVEEFADWQQQNELYFESQYQSHASGGIIPKWSLGDNGTPTHTDCILVDVLEQGEGTESPYLTDTVTVHYVGRLIPSASYASGYEFDRSYQGTFDEDIAVPSQFAVNGVVAGFGTALQHMHRGDKWKVTIPYQLGYGTSDYNGIPGYSTLIFELQLVDFWSKTKGDRE